MIDLVGWNLADNVGELSERICRNLDAGFEAGRVGQDLPPVWIIPVDRFSLEFPAKAGEFDVSRLTVLVGLDSQNPIAK